MKTGVEENGADMQNHREYVNTTNRKSNVYMWLDRLQSRKHRADKYGRRKRWILTCVVNYPFTVVISRRNSDTRSLDDQFNFEVIVVSHTHHFMLTSSTDQTIQLSKCKLVFIVKTPLVEVKQIQIVQHLLILIQFLFK